MFARHTWVLATLALMVLMLAGCPNKPGQGGRLSTAKQEPDKEPTSVALAVSAETSGKLTKLSPDECGIDFYNDVTSPDIWLGQASTQSGMAAADYDNDGDVDVFLVGIDTPNKLYRNEGNFTFKDVTAESGEGLDGGTAVGSAGVFADIDNDSDLDLYVCNKHEANQLFINDGSGHFKDEAKERGAENNYTAVQAAIFDADLDGDLDMYICNYRRGAESPQVMASMMPTETEAAKVPDDMKDRVYIDEFGFPKMKPDPDRFLLNDGTGKFTDATSSAGLECISFSFQAQACDLTNDGWPDIYLSSDFQTADRFFVNQGDGTFKDRAPDMVRKTPLFGMGVDTGDVNNDGLPDLYSADMLARDYKRAKRQSGDMWQWRREFLFHSPQPQMRNMLQINRGGGWFSEAGQLAGVDATDWTWAVRIADLNSDGLPELITTNGMTRDSMDVDTNNKFGQMISAGLAMDQITGEVIKQPLYKVQDYIFSASEPLKYKLVEDGYGFTDETFDAGLSLADYDGDGDRDFIINNTREKAMVLRNDLEQGNRIVVDLRQSGPNSQAVGARIWAYCGTDVAMDDIILARGFATGEPARAYLPLGKHDKVDRLVVRWPDNTVQEHKDMAAGMLWTIYKHNNLPKWEPEKKQAMFAQSDLDWKQKEVDTQAIEFEKEPLLPIQQSTLGTGAGVCDYDGDGRLDLYLAGAAGQKGQLFKGDGSGKFNPDPAFGGALPEGAEEMAVLWFDANGDGRQDLLVTSGGEEADPGSDLYLSKLYINSATGLTEHNLPPRKISTGAAAAADGDGDGDLDLLLCGHIAQYTYGRIVPSAYWINDGQGNFTDTTAAAIAGLDKGGQITDAQFADFNADGKADLVVSRFWGKVELWENGGGKFALKTSLTQPGWWRSLGIGDFDNDGDFDVICGNLGQATKYHPKDGAPVTLFANDFDKNGTRDLIEVKYRKDGCMLPGRGRSCSGYAIGYIPKKWPTWTEFADATLEDVYGPGLKTAERFEITDVHNIIAVNKGDGTFEEKDLPGTSQWAPAFGIAVGDYNCDGNLDAYVANNFSPSQPEAGHWNTGYGVLLIGDGSGGFADQWPESSGIRIYEDGRGAIAADFSGDGVLDILASVSNGAPKVCLADASTKTGESLMVTVTGKGANPAGVGTTLELTLSDGKKLRRVVQAGSGYLSSYCGPVHFGIPSGATATSLKAVWPGGATSETTEFNGGAATISQQ